MNKRNRTAVPSTSMDNKKPSNADGANRKSVTHLDIAQHVGVSQATVSKVLGNKANSIGISYKTRMAVIEAAKKLGYNQDKVASSLVQLAEKSIGVLLEHISNTYNSLIMAGIEEELNDKDYQYLFASSNGDPERSLRSIKSLSRRYTTGFVLLPFYESDTSVSVYDYLKSRSIPFVQTTYYTLPGTLETPLVTSDNREVFRRLTHHLFDQGHTKIMFFYTTPYYSSNAERLEGFKQAHAEKGISLTASQLIEVPRNKYFDPQLKRKYLHNWKSLKNPPTAIMTIKDDCAMQFIRVLENEGWKVPDDMAVTGCDDYYFFIPKYHPETYYRLTTVRQNLPEIGRRAIQVLIDMIENPEKRPESLEVIVPAKIIIRGSCGSSMRTEPDFDPEKQLQRLGVGHLTH